MATSADVDDICVLSCLPSNRTIEDAVKPEPETDKVIGPPERVAGVTVIGVRAGVAGTIGVTGAWGDPPCICLDWSKLHPETDANETNNTKEIIVGTSLGKDVTVSTCKGEICCRVMSSSTSINVSS